MNVFVSQVYIVPGINYRFSQSFQKWLGKEITNRVQPSANFIKAYSEDYDLMFRISAKTNIHEPEIRGPTVFRDSKDIEFTIFLPHDGVTPLSTHTYRRVMISLIEAVIEVLESLELDASRLSSESSDLIHKVITTPEMFKSQKR